MRIERAHQAQRTGGNALDFKIPMPEFLVTQMFNKGLEIGSIRPYKNSNIEIGIFLQPQSEVISFSEYFDSIRYITDSSHKLLVSSGCSSSAADLSIKTGSDHQADTELVTSLSIGSCYRPYHVACGVSYSLAD